MSIPTVQPPADAPHGTPGNAYARELEQRRRAMAAMRATDLTLGLHRNAAAAAFASLMRAPPTEAGRAPPAAPTPPPAVTRAFEQAVTERLRRGRNGLAGLGYADRAALVRRAGALGLSRFDAHLLIARVLHYHQQTGGAAGAAVRRRRSRAWAWAVLVVFALQGLLALLWVRVLGS